MVIYGGKSLQHQSCPVQIICLERLFGNMRFIYDLKSFSTDHAQEYILEHL